MKVFLVLGLAFGALVSFASQAAATKELQEGVTVKQKATDLEVSLVADKRRYRRQDNINLEVRLANTHGVQDLFVYGTLQFGHRASFTLYRRDAKGKKVPTRFIDDAWELPPKPNDTSAFVKLLPTTFWEPLTGRQSIPYTWRNPAGTRCGLNMAVLSPLRMLA